MTDLYRVLLCFRDGKNLQFCYKSEATSLKAWQALTQPVMETMSVARGAGEIGILNTPNDVIFTDDYGNTAKVILGDLSGVVHTNVNADLHAQTDLEIIQAHNQIYREKKMEADPLIREAVKRMQARQQLGVMNGQRAM